MLSLQRVSIAGGIPQGSVPGDRNGLALALFAQDRDKRTPVFCKAQPTGSRHVAVVPAATIR
jgi:hypothetical protein